MDDPLSVLESPPDAPPPPAMSFAARLLNVFAIPGEVFAGVKAGRVCVWNWLVPALLLTTVAVLTAVVVVSQPAVQRQMRELTEQQATILEKQVKAGNVKQAEADRVVALTRAITAPASLMLLSSLAAGVFGGVRVFWWAGVLWLLGRMFLKVRVGYAKALEVAGLALMISVLGGIVKVLLMVNLPKLFATTDLALAVSDFDAARKSPLLLGTENIFSFWLIGVLSGGLAKLAGVPFMRAAWFVFACWVIQESVFVLLGGALGQLPR